MQTLSRCICLGSLLVTVALVSAHAGTATDEPSGSVVWQAGVDGIEVEWSGDGSVRRISSRYSTPVEFSDRRGINTAQVIAEEKAKAAIVRFIQQSVASSRIAAEIETDLNNATQNRRTDTQPTVTKVDERKLVTSLTEVTGSLAAGNLTGVIVLERGFNDKTDEAWVVVGVSDKTIRAAGAVKNMLTGAAQPTKADRDNLGIQDSEVRKLNRKDW